MKTKLLLSILIVAGCWAASARGQTVQTATPAPAVSVAAPAPAPVAAPNQTVYAQRLPSVDELAKAAAAQGLAIDRVEQSASQITITYKYANGQTNTVAYLLLPGVTGAQPGQTQTAVVAPTTQAPTVYYAPTPAPTVVYYDDYPRYYSSYAYPYPRYYPPVSIGLGFGFRSGGYYHGGGSWGHHRR